MSDLPYVVAIKRVSAVLDKVQKAAVPDKFNADFLAKLGFTSSNDRALPSFFRKLGFLDGSNAPTARYKQLRNPAVARYAMADGVRDAYSELYAVDEKAHELSKEALRGQVATLTGGEEGVVNLVAGTFLELCKLADFNEAITKQARSPDTLAILEKPKPALSTENARQVSGQLDFKYNIEIHLPATTDLGVYNAIFRSLRENLLNK
jgi:Family of unknown function (DUF5343)